jgi:hypothetical protein
VLVTPFAFLADYIPFRKELKLRIDGNVGIISNEKDYRIDYLNETALTIFRLIDGKKTVADIAECFIKDNDVSRDVFERDLIEIIRSFQWQRLIVLKQRL